MIKKSLIAFLLIVLISLCGCSNADNNNSDNDNISINVESKTDLNVNNIDLDLTVLSSTMVYSEVYNIITNSDEYIGKTIKMSGLFSYYHDDISNNDYFACIIPDATACCSQGIEFITTEDYSYPEDYPKEDSEITVIGTFDTYNEGNIKYCHLKNAKLYST